MELKELESALEGVLFASGEPVAVERLCLGLEVDRPTLDAVAQRLMDQYSYERRGIRLIKLVPAISFAPRRSSPPISERRWRAASRPACLSPPWRYWRLSPIISR